MNTPVVSYPFSVSTTSSRLVVPTNEAEITNVYIRSKSTAIGTAVIAIKAAFNSDTAYPAEFTPAIRVGPLSASAGSYLNIDTRGVPYLVFECNTAESGEDVTITVAGWRR